MTEMPVAFYRAFAISFLISGILKSSILKCYFWLLEYFKFQFIKCLVIYFSLGGHG